MPASVMPRVSVGGNFWGVEPLAAVVLVTLARVRNPRTLTVPSGLILMLAGKGSPVGDAAFVRCFEGVDDLVERAQGRRRAAWGEARATRLRWQFHHQVVGADVADLAKMLGWLSAAMALASPRSVRRN